MFMSVIGIFVGLFVLNKGSIMLFLLLLLLRVLILGCLFGFVFSILFSLSSMFVGIEWVGLLLLLVVV